MNALTGAAVIGSGARGAPGPSVCLPEQHWKWFDWLPHASSFPPRPRLPFALLLNRRKKSCLHPLCPALWGLFSFSQLQSSSCCQPASGGPQCSSTAEQRAEPFPPLSASSGPPHLLSWRVGLCRRSPLSLSFFSSLHSWSFTFVSEVTFSTCFSSLLQPLLLVSQLFSFFFFSLLCHNSSPSFLFSCLYLLSFSSAVYCNVAFRDVCVCVCVCVF